MLVTVELGAAGNTAWVHGGSFDSYRQARKERFTDFEELRNRWYEEHAKLRSLMLIYKQKSAYNVSMASRYKATQTWLRKFEDAGPQALPHEQNVWIRLQGSRSGRQAVVCEDRS